MANESAFISKFGKEKIKLEYKSDGAKVIKLWESNRDRTLETTFDGDGAILLQKLSKFDGAQLQNRINEVIKNESISSVEERPYEEIRFKKSCPHCGTGSLMRYLEVYGSQENIPVMPIYVCKNCRNKSYYLTNSYLQYLVYSNKELFSSDEQTELRNDENAFITELKEYIIRIFASKKIMQIK